MDISELSSLHKVPIINIIDFFGVHNHDVDTFHPLTDEQVNLFNANLSFIKESLEHINPPTKIEIPRPKINSPKILDKIDLDAIDRSTRPLKGIKKVPGESTSSQGLSKKEDMLTPSDATNPSLNFTPRLMAAAKEFNISKETLVDFLVSKGFNRDDLMPTSKLSKEMYIALRDEFSSDKVLKFKSELVDLPPASNQEHKTHFKGIVQGFQDNGQKIRIAFVKPSMTFNKGKPVSTEIADKSRIVVAFKESWPNHKFRIGEKVLFTLENVERDGRKVKIAMPVGKKQEVSDKVDVAEAEELVFKPKTDIEPTSTNDPKEKTNTSLIKQDLEKIPQDTTKAPQKMNTTVTPLQKILFGSPGTGKSYQIVDAENSYFRQLIVESQKPDLIKTVFHPEYTYGDFMGKLMPLTNRGKVEYRYYSGHFMLALGTAYKNIIKAYIEYVDNVDEIEKDFKAEKRKNKSDYNDEEKAELQQRISAVQKPKPKNVLLVIDEINRGNSAAIFGTAFQLLDRDNAGWSSYPVKISDLELQELLSVTGLYYVREGSEDEVGAKFCGKKVEKRKYDEYVQAIFNDLDEDKKINVLENNIKIPPNLSIIATMNTSDNSIYFMDSAFKRRWDWEFIDITSEEQKMKQSGRTLEDGFSWDEFVDNLNDFIKKYGERIRKIEDKQIGYYFIKGDIIKHEAIRNKLMFFLWDSIFNNDKKPLKELIGLDKTLVTFGDFIKHYQAFIEAIKSKSFAKNVL